VLKWNEYKGQDNIDDDGSLTYVGCAGDEIVFEIRCDQSRFDPWTLVHLKTGKKWTNQYWSSCQNLARQEFSKLN